MTTGSLGQGMSVATGVAYGKKIEQSPYYTYTLVGDGELNEGQCWEGSVCDPPRTIETDSVCG